MLWLNFLHLYQPANSSSARIKEAVDKSYYRLTRLLEEHPDLRFTANISACLLERLKEEGYLDLIDRWRRLVSSGRLELVGSAAYHAFLPLLPEAEVQYQIKRQEEITAEILGVDLRGHGFFIPEMAYTPSLAKLIKNAGYRWLVLDEASLPSEIVPAAGAVYRDINSDLLVLVRQRALSDSYSPDLIQDLFAQAQPPDLLITATDAELYGLRHEDPTAELEKMVKLPGLNSDTVSEFLKKASNPSPVSFRAASWATDWSTDGRQPFIIWHNCRNRLQLKMWRLAWLVLAAGAKYQQDPNYTWYRWHLDRGLASCMFWWASGRDFSNNFGPKAWNPDEVETGLNDLIRAIRSLQTPESRREKIAAEKLLEKIRYGLWCRHWQNYF